MGDEAAAVEKQYHEIEKTLPARQNEWEAERIASGPAAEPKGPAVKFPLDADGNGMRDFSQKVEGVLKGVLGNSYRVQKKGWIEYGNYFDFEKDQPFTVSVWLRLNPEGGSPFGKMETGGDSRGWDVEFHGNKPSFHLISKTSSDAIDVQCEHDLPGDRFVHFTVTYDGSGKASGVQMS